MENRLFKLAQKDIQWAHKYLSSPHLSYGLSVDQWRSLLLSHSCLACLSLPKKRTPLSSKTTLVLEPPPSTSPTALERFSVEQLKQHAVHDSKAAQWLVQHHLLSNQLSSKDWLQIADNKPKLSLFLLQALNDNFLSGFPKFTLSQRCRLARWDAKAARELLTQHSRKLKGQDIRWLTSQHQELVLYCLKRENLKDKMSPKQWLDMAFTGPEAAQRILQSFPESRWKDNGTQLYALSQHFLGVVRWLVKTPCLSALNQTQQKTVKHQACLDECVLKTLKSRLVSDNLHPHDSKGFTPNYASQQKVKATTAAYLSVRTTKRNVQCK